MDVSSPIRSVIPSLDGPVLAALVATTKPLTLTAVHRLAGCGSLSGVRRVLLRLEDAGLVDAIPGGYALNREHLAAPAVEQLAQLHGALAARIRETVADWPGTVLLLGLYGSAARRDGDEASDIDLLLISDSDQRDDLVDLLSERIRRWTGNNAQVLAKSTADMARLQSAGEPILSRWERELLVLVGDKRHLRAVA